MALRGLGAVPKDWKWGKLTSGQKSYVTKQANRYAYAIAHPEEFSTRKVSKATAKGAARGEFRVAGQNIIIRKQKDVEFKFIAPRPGKDLSSVPRLKRIQYNRDGSVLTVETSYLHRNAEELLRVEEGLKKRGLKPYESFGVSISTAGRRSSKQIDIRAITGYHANLMGKDDGRETNYVVTFAPWDSDAKLIERIRLAQIEANRLNYGEDFDDETDE